MFEQNLQKIRASIVKKCEEINRNPQEILLVAVSKQQPVDSIRKFIALNVYDFGENKAQELKQKTFEITDDLNWHFIGHLQRNKVKDVVPFCHLIHSVDSLKLAKEIDKRAKTVDKVQNLLVELKTSDEASKYGITSDNEFNEIVDYCFNAENIKLQGLMTMAPFTNDENLIRASFKKLKEKFDELNEKKYNLNHLSMGMTNDYEIAIEEGATIIRIGTALFK